MLFFFFQEKNITLNNEYILCFVHQNIKDLKNRTNFICCPLVKENYICQKNQEQNSIREQAKLIPYTHMKIN